MDGAETGEGVPMELAPEPSRFRHRKRMACAALMLAGVMLPPLVLSDAVYLRTAQLAEIRIPRGKVEEMHPSNVSIMPKGLEKSMRAQDLSDLLEFLHSRR